MFYLRYRHEMVGDEDCFYVLGGGLGNSSADFEEVE